MVEYSKVEVEDLLKRADDAPNSDDAVHSLRIAEIRLQQERIKLAERSRGVAAEQLSVSKRANYLTEQLLGSNETASQENARSAKLMYDATEQLAKSTRSLNRATWVLVGFTAIQAIIAGIALYISLHPQK